MDYFALLPAELLDEIACDELTYHGLLSLPVFARSLTIGRRFDFMVKFGYDFHIIHYDLDNSVSEWVNEFTKNGNMHRVDGPASETSDGDKYWYINGNRHRLDGPAEEYSHGTKRWFINGKLHRLGGPAEEHSNGHKGWAINGKRYIEKEYNNIIANM